MAVPFVARVAVPRARDDPRGPRGAVAVTTAAGSPAAASATTEVPAAAPVARGRPLRRASAGLAPRVPTTGASLDDPEPEESVPLTVWAPPAIVVCGSSCTRLTPVTVVPSNARAAEIAACAVRHRHQPGRVSEPVRRPVNPPHRSHRIPYANVPIFVGTPLEGTIVLCCDGAARQGVASWDPQGFRRPGDIRFSKSTPIKRSRNGNTPHLGPFRPVDSISAQRGVFCTHASVTLR